MRSPRVPRARAAWIGVLLLAVLVGAVALRATGGPAKGSDATLVAETPATVEPTPTGEPTTTPTPDPFPSDPTLPTFFTVSSFNLLGAGHTDQGGNRKGWASGERRMKWAIDLLHRHDVQVVGFQEFQPPQYRVFMAEVGPEWGVYPGNKLARAAMHNSIAWRLDTWRLIQPGWMRIPYFHGDEIRMPVVLLQNVHNGAYAYFMNFHNPANARGNAQRWRNIAAARQIAKVNELRASTGLPVFMTGDMNEKDSYFCKVTGSTDLIAANGGSNSGSGCSVPRPTQVDWIFGSSNTWFTSYLADRSPLVRKTTDHPMIVSRTLLPPALLVNACGKLTLC